MAGSPPYCNESWKRTSPQPPTPPNQPYTSRRTRGPEMTPSVNPRTDAAVCAGDAKNKKAMAPVLSVAFLFFALAVFAALGPTPTLAANTTHPLLSTCPGAGVGVAVDEATHEVFVADRSAVERFSFSGGTCSLVETLDGTAAGGFSSVRDVAFDAKLNRLFVLNEGSVVDVFEVGTGEHYLFSIAGGAGVPL